MKIFARTFISQAPFGGQAKNLSSTFVAYRDNHPHIRTNYYIFPYFRKAKIGIMF